MVHPRHLISAGADSEAAVVQSLAAPSGYAFFNNTLTQIKIGDRARLDHYLFAQTNTTGFHVLRNEASLGVKSSYRAFIFASDTRFFRNETVIDLKSAQGNAQVDGLFLTDRKEHMDQVVLIQHRAPEGTSRQMLKGIAQGASRLAVNAKVYVHPGAQKTDAEQTLKNLLLSPDAVVDARPQFEIFADDVKCSHGAAIGQLEDDLIFYLKSRGIGESEARKILTRGFASEVIEKFELPGIRQAAEKALGEYFSA